MYDRDISIGNPAIHCRELSTLPPGSAQVFRAFRLTTELKDYLTHIL